MRTLDAEQIRAATPWPELIDAIAHGLRTGTVASPDRHVHELGMSDGGTGSLLLMPSWIDGETIGVKTVTYFPTNAGAGVSTIHAAYLLFDGGDGRLLAALDGDELTARRTAAVSALAAEHLARPDADRLLVVGTGQLAPNMARAHATVRQLRSISIWGRDPDAAGAVVARLAGEGLPVEVAQDLDDGIERADIVSCVTGATEPIVRGARLARGSHVDLVGAFRSDMRECDDAAVTRASLFVDTMAGGLRSGDLAQPLADGVITEDSIAADLRALVNGEHPGRRSVEEITLFESAGFAGADLATARLAWGSV